MDTTMTDFRLPEPPAWPDDITYCGAMDCIAGCYRKQSCINWEIPRHKYYGASIADFGEICASYESGVKSNES